MKLSLGAVFTAALAVGSTSALAIREPAVTSVSGSSSSTSTTSSSSTTSHATTSSSTTHSTTSTSSTHSSSTSTKPATKVNAAAATTGTPVRNGGKRGLAFNDPSLTKEFSLSGQNSLVNWAYNWASQPYYGGSYPPNSFNPALTYIPMLWSNASDLTSIWNANVNAAITNYRADSVLAFNEPDGCGGGSACMTVPSAVTAYKKWIMPFKGRVKLGAPAVTNGVGANIGVNWLQQFINQCTGCEIDFIPIHWYGDVNSPSSFTSYVQSVYTKFGKPVWVTEFAPTSGSDAQVLAFLEQVIPWLIAQSWVTRFSYFMDRNTGPPFLLYPNNTFTDIGLYYNSNTRS